MIKKLLSIALVALGVNTISAQSFSLIYNFSSVVQAAAAATNSIDPTPTPTAVGVSSGSFMAVNTGTGSTGGGRFSFVDWPTGATTGNDTYSALTGSIDLNKYYSITITPAANYLVDFNTISVRIQRSGTGIRTYAVRGSKDGYAANLPGSVSTGTLLSLQANNIFFWGLDATTTGQNGTQIALPVANYSAVPAGNPVSFRFYGWNAEGNGGTFSIDSVNISGNAVFSVGAGLAKISHDLNAKFKLYPNPSNDGFVMLEATTANYSKIEVFNLLGAVVASQNNSLAEEKVKLDLATLPAGTYFVKINSGDKSYTEKLIITK